MNHNGFIFMVNEVIYVPEDTKNLISFIADHHKGMKILFDLHHCAIIKDDKVIKLKLRLTDFMLIARRSESKYSLSC